MDDHQILFDLIDSSKEELKLNVQKEIASRLLSTICYDGDGDQYSKQSKLYQDLEKVVKKGIEDKFKNLFDNHISKILDRLVESCIKEDIMKKTDNKTDSFSEYLTSYLERYLDEKVTFDGKKIEGAAPLGNRSRFYYLVEKSLDRVIREYTDYSADYLKTKLFNELGEVVKTTLMNELESMNISLTKGK